MAGGAAWLLGCRLKRLRRPRAVAGSDVAVTDSRPVADSGFLVADSGFLVASSWWPIRAAAVAHSGLRSGGEGDARSSGVHLVAVHIDEAEIQRAAPGARRPSGPS